MENLNFDRAHKIIDHNLLSSVSIRYKKTATDNANKNIYIKKAALAVSIDLSFKEITQIDNLQGFTKLLKLKVDNNNISKIQNLEGLRDLKVLDLSFNKIEIIEGLGNLKNLKDLSLFSNLIKSVNGLDACKKIECLSLGKNQISFLTGPNGACTYLRKFRELRALGLKGNSVYNQAEYHELIFAYLPTLRYLDYKLIKKSKVLSARERYKDEIRDLQCDDSKKSRGKTCNKEYTGHAQSLKLTILDLINGTRLDLLQKVEEYNVVSFISKEFEHRMKCAMSIIHEAVEDFMTASVVEDGVRVEFMKKFNGKIKLLRDEDIMDIEQKIENFLSEKNQTLSSRVQNKELLLCTRLQENLCTLHNYVMEKEINQLKLFEDAMRPLEVKFNDIKERKHHIRQICFGIVETQILNVYNSALGFLKGDNTVEDIQRKHEGTDVKTSINCDLLKRQIKSLFDEFLGRLSIAKEKSHTTDANDLESLIESNHEDARERYRDRIVELTKYVNKMKTVIDVATGICNP